MLVKREYKYISVDDFDSMAGYQRPLDINFVEEKIKEFDKYAVECPKISVRNDGTKKCGDGQHTIAIVKGVGWKTIRCELRYGLTIEEENDWFAQENGKRRSQSKKRILTAKVNGTYERNKIEQDFNKCIKSLGFRLDIYGENPGSDYKINCPINLLSIYKQYVAKEMIDNFIECMDLIKSCWNGSPVSLHWNFIRGIFDFYETYNNAFDRKRFTVALSKKSPVVIKEMADNDKYTKKSSLKYAKIFVNEYNAGLSKSKRLKMSLLED